MENGENGEKQRLTQNDIKIRFDFIAYLISIIRISNSFNLNIYELMAIFKYVVDDRLISDLRQPSCCSLFTNL